MSHKFPGLFLQNCKKLEVKEYVYFVAAFDPNWFFSSWALQNDRQNLSFVKAIDVDGKTMARNGSEMAIL